MSSLNAGGGTHISWEEIDGQRVGFIRSCESNRIASLEEIEDAVRFRLKQVAEKMEEADADTYRLEGEEEALEWVLRVIEGPKR